MWQSGSELGVVAYDIDPLSKNIYHAQSAVQSQMEQLGIIRFMPDSERVFYIGMYLSLELRYDEMKDETKNGQHKVRFGFLDNLPGQSTTEEEPIPEEVIVVEEPTPLEELPAEDVGKLLMANLQSSQEDDEAMLRMMEED